MAVCNLNRVPVTIVKRLPPSIMSYEVAIQRLVVIALQAFLWIESTTEWMLIKVPMQSLCRA